MAAHQRSCIAVMPQHAADRLGPCGGGYDAAPGRSGDYVRRIDIAHAGAGALDGAPAATGLGLARGI